MRRIQKKPEPPSLTMRRETPGGNTWSAVHGTEKQDMRQALYSEQHGLCAYCLSRLPGTTAESGMRIEHWTPRSKDPTKHLCWPNLLGVCRGDVGGDGTAEQRFCCDQYRGDEDLHVDPATYPPDAAGLFRYSGTTGEMGASLHLTAQERHEVNLTIERLNLNVARLRRNRLAIIDHLRDKLRSGRLTRSKLQGWLADLHTPRNGLLPPYCEVASQYLAKKKRQKGW